MVRVRKGLHPVQDGAQYPKETSYRGCNHENPNGGKEWWVELVSRLDEAKVGDDTQENPNDFHPQVLHFRREERAHIRWILSLCWMWKLKDTPARNNCVLTPVSSSLSLFFCISLPLSHSPFLAPFNSLIPPTTSLFLRTRNLLTFFLARSNPFFFTSQLVVQSWLFELGSRTSFCGSRKRAGFQRGFLDSTSWLLSPISFLGRFQLQSLYFPVQKKTREKRFIIKISTLKLLHTFTDRYTQHRYEAWKLTTTSIVQYKSWRKNDFSLE